MTNKFINSVDPVRLKFADVLSFEAKVFQLADDAIFGHADNPFDPF